jgi:hypothetical protein
MREGGGSWWEWVERAGAAEADGEVNSRAGGGGWACAGAMRWASSRGAPGRTGRGLLMGAGMVPPQSANRSPRPAQHSPRLSRWLALEADAEALRTGFALPAAALAALLSTPWPLPPSLCVAAKFRLPSPSQDPGAVVLTAGTLVWLHSRLHSALHFPTSSGRIKCHGALFFLFLVIVSKLLKFFLLEGGQFFLFVHQVGYFLLPSFVL